MCKEDAEVERDSWLLNKGKEVQFIPIEQIDKKRQRESNFPKEPKRSLVGKKGKLEDVFTVFYNKERWVWAEISCPHARFTYVRTTHRVPIELVKLRNGGNDE